MATTPRSRAKTQPPSAAIGHLLTARKYLTQADIAAKLGVDIRTVRRWEVRSSEPPAYAVHALQRLLPLQLPDTNKGLFRLADLFAGIGGIRLAFEKLGGKCVYTSEWDAYAQKTYAANFPDGHVIAGDITRIAASDIPEHDVLLAGFPIKLFSEVARIIKARRPRAFLLENVKNLQSHDGGRTFATICKVLRDELKYDIHCKVVDGAHFVPQHRERILIAGFAEPVAFDWNAIPLHAKNQRKLKTILHRVDDSEPMLEHDGARFFDHKARRVNAKYTLTDNLWRYLQDYAAKHKARGNGFGFGLVGPEDVSRTLSARYYKDGSDTRAYQLFAGAAVVPMIEYAANLVVAQWPRSQAAGAPTVDNAAARTTMTSTRWNKDQLKLAFYLYCQLPFGKLHRGNREIVSLAKLMGRTPSAVAMKLVNFASFDPAITNSGRKGLGNASTLDREVWDEFNADWEGLAVECQKLRQALMAGSAAPDSAVDELIVEETQDYTGETKIVIVEQRVKQAFFRRAVLSSYRGRCCLSGIAEPKLLMASHIVPWSKDKANRLNPRNGLCLSALHDRAFDRGLIGLTDDFRVCISESLKRRRGEVFIRDVLLPLEGRSIELPERFHPDPTFIAYHRKELFNSEAAE
jgi:DNA (cytosine-5)-methyltransferase 1